MRTFIALSLVLLAPASMSACCRHQHDEPQAAVPSAASGGETGPSAAAATPSTAAAAITTKEVQYSSGTTQLNGLIAYPAGSDERPAVLVVHEWWGVNDYPRSRAKQLAELGYVAFAIDMYGGGKVAAHPEDAKKFSGEVMSNMPEAKARFDAARALLAADPRVDSSKIAAIGYCFGGAVVLAMARAGEPLAAIASFHGMLGTAQPMQPGAYPGRIFVATGGADPFVPAEQVEAFKKEMDAAGAHYEVAVYPGAQHAFTNPAATEAGKQFQLPVAYDAAADSASWSKLQELLEGM